MNISREKNESLTDYQIRLFENAKLLNLSRQEIADILNKESGLNYSESKWRKEYASYVRWSEYERSKNSEPNQEIDKLEEKIKEFEIQKIQFQDKKREYKNYLKHEARLDNLLKGLIDGIKDEINSTKPLVYNKEKTVFRGDTALTLLLSDLHKGMVTDNHWNKFNDEIFNNRMTQTIEETIAYQKLTGAKHLHIMQLGDLIEGNLHRLTKIGETENAVEQTKSVAEALSDMVSLLASYFETVTVHSVKGNHDRVSSRKEEEIKTESFHDFITWYMAARLENFENVSFNENNYDSEIIVADILGKTYFGIHGHLEKGYNSVIQNLTMMIQKFPTAIFAGHIHKNFENEVHGVDLIINGGFAGTNDYAKDNRLVSKAHQKLLWLDENGRKATFYIKY